jgi:predicted DNA-binding protein
MIYDDVIMMISRQYQMRTIIDLPDEQISGLANLCKQNNSSRAELIRRAVAEYLLQHRPEQDDYAFGIWKQRMVNGLDYQNRLRKEWDE